MTAVTDQALGGKPSAQTSKDKRLKENKRGSVTKAVPMDGLPSMAASDPALDAPATGAPFTTLMLVEGMETSDGRMFELNSTTWRDCPLPLMVQDTSPHGPGQTPAPAWAAGQIESIDRDPTDMSRIIGTGHLMANDAGQRAEELIRGAMRGVSVDAYGDGPLPPDMQAKVVDQDGAPVSVLVRYADSVISRLTLVPTPAFAPCCIWMGDEEMPQAAADAHGASIPTDTEPEVVNVPTNAFELLVASGGGPLHPDKAVFFQPEPNHRQEIILKADGSWCGHLVGKRECHAGYLDHCELAPPSRTTPPFLAFHHTEAHCADGSKVACGWIAIDTNHSRLMANGHREAERWSQEDTWEHYENSGKLIAKARASNGRHGVWLSGCLIPGLGDRELSIAQGLSVSGHWNVYTDPRDGRKYRDELLAVLGGVPVPGYPETRTRPELLVASGEVVGHIAGLEADCGCDDCNEENAMSAADLDRIAALERTVGILVAHAGDDALAELSAAVIDDANVDDFVAGIAAGIAEETDALDEAIEGLAMFADLNTPLSAAELARYHAKYDKESRAAAATDGHALRDGTVVLEDADDVRLAIRAWSGDERTRQHIIRNAERLECSDLTLSGDVALGKYNMDQLNALLKKGQAMPPLNPGGPPRYPIGDADDADAAVHAVGRAKGSHADVRAFITKVLKKLGMESKIPDSWKS